MNLAPGGAVRLWLRRATLALLVALLLLQAWYFGWVLYWRWHNPALTAFMRHEIARREQAAGSARPPAKPRELQRIWVDYAHLSGNLKRAVITAEDARFVQHDGVDWEAMEKAFERNRQRGRTTWGGSTISQQLAKNLFLSSQRSYLRKLQELLITFMLEVSWNKRRILEVYLNVVEWGDGIYGAEAGARHYFGASAAALDPSQAARMAAMLPAPKFFDRHREAAFLERRAEDIERYLSEAQIP